MKIGKKRVHGVTWRTLTLNFLVILGLAACGPGLNRAGMNGEMAGSKGSLPGPGPQWTTGSQMPPQAPTQSSPQSSPSAPDQSTTRVPSQPGRPSQPHGNKPHEQEEPENSGNEVDKNNGPLPDDVPESAMGHFKPLGNSGLSNGYLKHFENSGRPRFGSTATFRDRLERKFASHLNQSKELSSKSERIFQEIVRAVNREVATDRGLMLLPTKEARHWSEQIERSGGRSPKRGAWSIAVKQTAVRHGFANVPCAEFVSEVVREAYARAGYDVLEDFNKKRDNQLIWHETSAVKNLTRALVKAGWVPWSTYVYRPPIGAIMLNGLGETPGHAYFAAGLNGRLIVDNGAPQGRDLAGKTSQATIAMMFSSGVFILPPGINPAKWVEK